MNLPSEQEVFVCFYNRKGERVERPGFDEAGLDEEVASGEPASGEQHAWTGREQDVDVALQTRRRGDG